MYVYTVFLFGLLFWKWAFRPNCKFYYQVDPSSQKSQTVATVCCLQDINVDKWKASDGYPSLETRFSLQTLCFIYEKNDNF